MQHVLSNVFVVPYQSSTLQFLGEVFSFMLHCHLYVPLFMELVSSPSNDDGLSQTHFDLCVCSSNMRIVMACMLQAVISFLTMQFQLSSVFFTFSLGTRTHYFGRTLLHGGAKVWSPKLFETCLMLIFDWDFCSWSWFLILLCTKIVLTETC